MASVVALMGFPGRDCYTAAKGGIAALTRSLAVEYAPQKVRVNAIAPCVTLTDRVNGLLAGNEGVRKVAEAHLLGLGQPMDMAQAALYLASDESRHHHRPYPAGRQRHRHRLNRRLAWPIPRISASSASARWARRWPNGCSPRT